VGQLIEDPWRTSACELDPTGWYVTFEDPDSMTGARDTLYYVRAIEEEPQAIHADNLRCSRDDEGVWTAVDRCGSAETAKDDCLKPTGQRAWSSPIFVGWSG
jgi:hypothetical protein